MFDEELTDYEDVFWALEDISNTMISGEREVSINISFTETIPTNSRFERIVFECKPDACIDKRKTCKGCEYEDGAYKSFILPQYLCKGAPHRNLDKKTRDIASIEI